LRRAGGGVPPATSGCRRGERGRGLFRALSPRRPKLSNWANNDPNEKIVNPFPSEHEFREVVGRNRTEGAFVSSFVQQPDPDVPKPDRLPFGLQCHVAKRELERSSGRLAVVARFPLRDRDGDADRRCRRRSVAPVPAAEP
jgi:hypothetical protein